jgi:histidinol dehydrogenase
VRLAIHQLGSPDAETFLARLEERGTRRLAEAEGVAREIVRQVEAEGDVALVRLEERLDGVRMAVSDLRVPLATVRQAAARAPLDVREALGQAAARVRRFHEAQRRAVGDFEIELDGILAGQRAMPLDRAGVYVPGGRAAYPSTVLMNVIPAQVAGVAEIAVATPPGALERNPAVAAALDLLGVEEIYALGGAQAIAALALGTRTVRAVDKVVGPGNLYVNAAKRLVAGRVGVDGLAGPSDVVVAADSGARPAWVAADLLAQAEHDEEASAVALVPSAEFADRVRAEVERAAADLPRRDLIHASLERYGAALVYGSESEALAAINRLGPEHLALHVQEPRRWHARVRHAGSVFLGEHTAEVLGDYGCGPNHVLPTAGASRYESALGVLSFLRFGQWLEAGRDAARRAAPMVESLAAAEGLQAHARAMRLRREESA